MCTKRSSGKIATTDSIATLLMEYLTLKAKPKSNDSISKKDRRIAKLKRKLANAQKKGVL